MEFHLSFVTERNSSKSRLSVRNLEHRNDTRHKLQHLRKSLVSNGTGYVNHKNDVILVVTACKRGGIGYDLRTES